MKRIKWKSGGWSVDDMNHQEKNIIKEIKEGMWGGVSSWKDVFSLYDLSYVSWCNLRIFYNELIFSSF